MKKAFTNASFVLAGIVALTVCAWAPVLKPFVLKVVETGIATKAPTMIVHTGEPFRGICQGRMVKITLYEIWNDHVVIKVNDNGTAYQVSTKPDDSPEIVLDCYHVKIIPDPASMWMLEISR